MRRLHHWLRRAGILDSRRAARRPESRSGRVQVWIEPLEDRTVPATFGYGDVLIGGLALTSNHDYVRWYNPNGNLVQVLDTGQYGTGVFGMALDSDHTLYAADSFAGVVSKFDSTGALQGTFGTNVGSPEPIVFDAFGTAYFGQVSGPGGILKLDPNGNQLANFNPALAVDGINAMDIAADQRTVFYATQEHSIKRFDVINNKQLPDFATDLPDIVNGLVVLPDGGMLVADNGSVLRLDSTGNIVQTYNTPVLPGGWNSVALDPDGHSFWTIQSVGTLVSGNPPNSVYEYDIASGVLENSFLTTPTMADDTLDVAVVGPPRFPMAILPPPDQSYIEGGSQAVPLGAFMDTTGFGPWNVRVNWGDGSADTTFQTTSKGSLGTQNHSFDEGSWTVTVTVTDAYSERATSNTFQVEAAELPVQVTGGFLIKPIHGVPFTATVATFTDPGGAEPDAAAPGGTVNSHYLALIDWGDSSSFGNISYNGTPGSTTGVFTVTGTHTYMTNGLHTITVNILHELGPDTTFSTASSLAEEIAVMPPDIPDFYEGTQGYFDLGSFSDPNGGPWTVEVNWGDGTPHTTFSIANSGSLGQKFHAFDEEGTKSGTVTVTNTNSGQSASAPLGFAVREPALIIKAGLTIQSSQGVPFSATVATFTDPGGAEPNASDDPGGPLSDHYTATIDWGDNTQSAGVITFNGTPGSTTDPFTITGSHTYASGGTHTITVHLTHESNEFIAYSTDVQPLILLPAGPQSSDEGSSKFFNLGSFTDTLGGTMQSWAVSVDWGDGRHTTFKTKFTGALTSQNHRYGEEGLKTVTVTVTDTSKFSAVTTFQVNVAEVPVTASGNQAFTAALAAPFFNKLAAFRDPAGFEPNPDDEPGSPLTNHYQATIDWGDNSPTSAGVMTRTPMLIQVAGEHTYAANGTYTISVTINHEGTATKATDRITVQSVVNHASACGDANSLVIGASAAGDVIRVVPVGPQAGSPTDIVKVLINNVSQGTYTGFDQIAIFGQGGNDDLEIAPGIRRSAWIFGGGGNDIIAGSSGHNVLVGGSGNDSIAGGAGFGLIIGGGGIDQLTSVGHGDVLVGGWTDFDNPAMPSNIATLRSVVVAWIAAQSYNARAAHVLSLFSTNGTNAAHVHDDAGTDAITGGTALDLFFAGIPDVISGRHAPELGYRPDTGTPF
jgi:hypothetical protein